MHAIGHSTVGEDSLEKSGDLPRALLVAFHFPPFHGGSGHQRTLSFSRYLPQYGWEPLVLTADPRAYLQANDDQMSTVPRRLVVKRAFALDTRKHLSIRYKYPGFLAIPDRWVSWWLGAVPAGLKLIRHYRPGVIWATYPTASALLVAYTLHRLSSLPLVADFRDPMIPTAEDGYLNSRVRRWIERRVVQSAAKVVFTTFGAARAYARKFPNISDSTWSVIPNGYDEENFSTLELSAKLNDKKGRPLKFLHSGALFKEERDPRPFFTAIAALLHKGGISAGDLEIVLRGTSNDKYFRELADSMNVESIVSIKPSISYREALAEMVSADGLLLFQGSAYNGQIPAKVYEYMRIRRPILALTDPEGDTAAVLKSAGIDTIAHIDMKEEIETVLAEFITRVRNGTAPLVPEDTVRDYSRRSRTESLAALFNEVLPESALQRTR